MGLLDAYQDSTDTALRVMAARPLEPESPAKQSAWKMPYSSVGDYVRNQLTIPRALAAGAAEVAGNVMDTAGAFGQVAAAAGGLTPGFDPDAAKNRNATVEAFDKLKTEGINWRTDEAQQAYKFGADLRPDPLTAGKAENIVFGLTKGLTKAIGAAVTLGPVGGAAAFGTSEGLTTAEDLANQGVDQQTRTKVGAVTGVMSAAGVALPVAGKSLAQTAGLVLVGGPASFMAQQAATREILRNADYKAIAEQYDPLDPVGLTVATLLPAGFAAYAKRGGFGAKPKPDVAPVSEAVPDSNVIAATPEAIDAAMVQNLTVARDVQAESKTAADQTLSSIEAFLADAKRRAIDGLMADRAEMARVASGEMTPTEAARASSRFRTSPDEARARIAEIDALIADAKTRYVPEDATMQAAYQMHRMRAGMDEAPPTAPLPTVKDSLTTQPDPSNSVVRENQTAETTDSYAARVDAIAKEQPDLIARLDEAGQPVKLADELATIKKQAQEGTDTDFGALDAPLLKTAIECALSLGAA